MDRTLIVARLLRAATWLVPLGTALTGLVLLLQRTTVWWEPIPGTEFSSEANPLDVTGIGLALLCTGILSLVIVLVVESYLVRTTHRPRIDAPREPDET